MCQDNLGVEGVVIYDGDADTKKVRIGARSSVAKVKESETEDKATQQALFEKNEVKMNVNTKDWAVALGGAGGCWLCCSLAKNWRTMIRNLLLVLCSLQ